MHFSFQGAICSDAGDSSRQCKHLHLMEAVCLALQRRRVRTCVCAVQAYCFLLLLCLAHANKLQPGGCIQGSRAVAGQRLLLGVVKAVLACLEHLNT